MKAREILDKMDEIQGYEISKEGRADEARSLEIQRAANLAEARAFNKGSVRYLSGLTGSDQGGASETESWQSICFKVHRSFHQLQKARGVLYDVFERVQFMSEGDLYLILDMLRPLVQQFEHLQHTESCYLTQEVELAELREKVEKYERGAKEKKKEKVVSQLVKGMEPEAGEETKEALLEASKIGGEELKRVRKQLGLTQVAAAKLLGVSDRTMKTKENGR